MNDQLPIFLPTSASTADEHAPLDWLGRYCSKLVENGPYEWSDLPPAARWFCALDTYAGEVTNGGHMQYFQNTRLMAEEIDACKAGFACLPVNAFTDIFEQAAIVMTSPPDLLERFLEHDVTAWSADELDQVEASLNELDQRFFRDAGGSSALFKLAGQALLARAEVRLVDEQAEQIKQALRRHPDFKESEPRGSKGGATLFPPRPLTEQQQVILSLAARVCKALRRSMAGLPIRRNAKIRIDGQWYDALELNTDRGLLLLVQIASQLAIYDASDTKEFRALGTFPLRQRLDFEQMRASELEGRQAGR
nr:DUF4375 domain-containing protein [Erythrobacter sp. KY5]